MRLGGFQLLLLIKQWPLELDAKILSPNAFTIHIMYFCLYHQKELLGMVYKLN